MMIGKTGLALFAVASFVAFGANAATYTFEFDNSTTGWVTSTQVGANEDSSLKITASGASYNDAKTTITPGSARVGTWTNAGLGVCSTYERGNCTDGDHRVDGYGANDIALFSLPDLYDLTSISFSYFDDYIKEAEMKKVKTTCRVWNRHGNCVDWNYEWVVVTPEVVYKDMFDLFADLGAGLVYQFTAGVVPTFDLTTDIKTASFGIGATGSYDAFKIKAITVESIPATVPVPAAGLMLVAGVGGLAALRRRRKAA